MTKPKKQGVQGDRAREARKAELVEVTGANVDARGFFCYMSKKKAEGYQRKRQWLKDRFFEGMRLKLLAAPERGFIEYIPGESAWRAVHADGYMFVHCLWVVGKSKGKGFGTALLDECVSDARRSRMKGVAMVTSERVWLAGKRILASRGFECVDQAPPAFSLMALKFGKYPSPSLAGDWEHKARALPKGLCVVRSDQCPYVVDAAATALRSAEKAGREHHTVELRSRDDLLRLSPSPYGVFGITLDGALLSYHYLLEKDLLPVLR